MRFGLDIAPEPYTVTLACDDSPEGERIRWSLRPLRQREMDAALDSAGPEPMAGREPHGRWVAWVREGAPEPCPLSSEDLASAAALRSWAIDRAWAVVSAALVAVDGHPVEDARTWLGAHLTPEAWVPTVVLELAAHAQEVVGLSPKARASYGSPSGSGGTAPAGGGGAGTAPAPPSC